MLRSKEENAETAKLLVLQVLDYCVGELAGRGIAAQVRGQQARGKGACQGCLQTISSLCLAQVAQHQGSRQHLGGGIGCLETFVRKKKSSRVAICVAVEKILASKKKKP